MPGPPVRDVGLPLLALLCAGVAGPDEARAREPVDAYVEAFKATCLKGFPDLDAVARAALADGWSESRLRSAAEPGTAPPRAFRKGTLLLLLARPAGGEFKGLCHITSSADGRTTGAEVVAALSRTLADARPVPAESQDLEGATWLLAEGRDVQAGVQLARLTRSISIVARERR